MGFEIRFSSGEALAISAIETLAERLRLFLPIKVVLILNGHLVSSTVVFWVARGNLSPCHNHRLLGEQRGEEIFRPLPECEARVGIQDQPLDECLRLLTTRFPNGFDG